MKYFATIDTNVLVSAALKPISNPGAILKLVDDGVVIPLVNNQILSEYQNVLSRPKFAFPKELVEKLLEILKRSAIFIQEKHIDIALPDEKDRVFYEVTMTSRTSRESKLITGNIKHFPSKHFIITPKDFCENIFRNSAAS